MERCFKSENVLASFAHKCRSMGSKSKRRSALNSRLICWITFAVTLAIGLWKYSAPESLSTELTRSADSATKEPELTHSAVIAVNESEFARATHMPVKELDSARSEDISDKAPKKSLQACGILFTLGLHTPLIKAYEDRWSKLGGRGPYISELLEALKSARKTQSLPVAVVTDANLKELRDRAPGIFDLAQVIQANFSSVLQGWGDKIVAFSSSPFERTIAFDTDVTLCSDLSHACHFLDTYDMAMAREIPTKDLWLSTNSGLSSHYYNQIRSLNFHNSGVVMFKLTQAVRELLKDWHAVHNKHGGGDQNHLANKLHSHTKIRHLLLPEVYNFRAHTSIGPAILRGQVFVIHSRSGCMSCEFLNSMTQIRLSVPSKCAMYELHANSTFRVHTSQFFRNSSAKVEQEMIISGL